VDRRALLVRWWWGGLQSEVCDAATPSPRAAVSSPHTSPAPCPTSFWPGSDPEEMVPVFVLGRGRRRNSEPGQVCF
jgi:hypothetical protein